MAKLSPVLLLTLFGLVSSRNAYLPNFSHEVFQKNPTIDNDEDVENPIPVRVSEFQNNHVEGVFPEPQEAGTDDEYRFQTGRVVKNPPPFIVGLTVANGDVFCTASLISKDKILTAAHCFGEDTGDLEMNAVLGLSDIRVFSRFFNQWRANVTVATFTYADVKKHDGYKGPPRNLNDIAIITLGSPVKKAHKPITVASKDSFRKKLKGAGWGLKDCNHSSENALREADGIYIPNEKCSKLVGRIHDTKTCVLFENGGEAVGAASGDSGGPLYSEENPSEPVQIGITSYVYTTVNPPEGQNVPFCTNKAKPQIFTKVSEFTKFIKDNAPGAKFTP